LTIAKWFRRLWDRLDEETKRKIIGAIMIAVEELLRSYYQWRKQRTEKDSTI
jgi:hypothetical protein